MPNHDHPDVTNDKVAATAGNSNLSQQVFINPAEFLQTLRKDFKEMSHGHDSITLEDLQTEAKSGSDAKDRLAAAITASHFSDLAGIAGQQALRSSPTNSITMDDLNWASDMNAHRTLKYTAENIGTDVLAAATCGALGGVTGAVGLYELGSGVGMFGGAASAALSFAWLGTGIGGVAAAGYLGYEAFKEHSRMTNTSNKDALMFSSWLKPKSE